MKAWRHHLDDAVAVATAWLQFGHAGEGVETTGAPRISTGVDKGLQFGHAGEGVETQQAAGEFNLAIFRLQFGHAGEGVETIPPFTDPGPPVASIRPRR